MTSRWQEGDHSNEDAATTFHCRALAELRSAVAAAQLAEPAAFDESQRQTQAAAGLRAVRRGRGVAGQVALARRMSPHRAGREVRSAKVLVELPRTFAALRAGEISEWRALMVARETGWLSREHRLAVDVMIAAQLGTLGTLGDRQLQDEIRRLGYRLDPTGYLARLSHAEDDRRVGLRAAPDVMGYLTALLTLPQAAACYTALTRHADSLIAGGDGRSRGQIMADTLVARLTGQETAVNVPVEINLIMTDQALFGPDVVAAARAAAATDPGDPAAGEPSGAASHQPDDVDGVDGADDLDGDDAGGGDAEVADTDGEEPAYLLGYGYLPAPYARQLILGASTRTPRWLRRLFRDPRTGQLAAMESRRRCFTPAQRRFVQLRDEVCRTPWCGAAEDGTVTITTPTGHQYQHRAPDPPGDPPSPESVAA